MPMRQHVRSPFPAPMRACLTSAIRLAAQDRPRLRDFGGEEARSVNVVRDLDGACGNSALVRGHHAVRLPLSGFRAGSSACWLGGSSHGSLLAGSAACSAGRSAGWLGGLRDGGSATCGRPSSRLSRGPDSGIMISKASSASSVRHAAEQQPRSPWRPHDVPGGQVTGHRAEHDRERRALHEPATPAGGDNMGQAHCQDDGREAEEDGEHERDAAGMACHMEGHHREPAKATTSHAAARSWARGGAGTSVAACRWLSLCVAMPSIVAPPSSCSGCDTLTCYRLAT